MACSARGTGIPEACSRVATFAAPGSEWPQQAALVPGRGLVCRCPKLTPSGLCACPLAWDVGYRHIAKACLARGLEKASRWQWYLLRLELNQVRARTRKEYFGDPETRAYLVRETGRKLLVSVQLEQKEDVQSEAQGLPRLTRQGLVTLRRSSD